MAALNRPTFDDLRRESDAECRATRPMIETPVEVFRVIDDGDCILTTLDPRKALFALMELIDKHEVTACWADHETLQ